MTIFLLLTLGRSHANEEGSPAPRRGQMIFQSGISGLFDGEKNPTLAVEYRWGRSYAGMEPWLGGGWATDGAVFAGAGIVHTWEPASSPWSVGLGFGPGYYERNEGTDLGSQLEFYSFIEVGFEVRAGQSILLRLGHISNGSIEDENPGTELLTVGYSIRLR